MPILLSHLTSCVALSGSLKAFIETAARFWQTSTWDESGKLHKWVKVRKYGYQRESI